jgi:hypothetical protein
VAISGDVMIQVVDMTGRVLRYDASFNNNQTELDLSGMARGTYLLKVETSGKLYHTRVVLM